MTPEQKRARRASRKIWNAAVEAVYRLEGADAAQYLVDETHRAARCPGCRGARSLPPTSAACQLCYHAFPRGFGRSTGIIRPRGGFPGDPRPRPAGAPEPKFHLYSPEVSRWVAIAELEHVWESTEGIPRATLRAICYEQGTAFPSKLEKYRRHGPGFDGNADDIPGWKESRPFA